MLGLKQPPVAREFSGDGAFALCYPACARQKGAYYASSLVFGIEPRLVYVYMQCSAIATAVQTNNIATGTVCTDNA